MVTVCPQMLDPTTSEDALLTRRGDKLILTPAKHQRSPHPAEPSPKAAKLCSSVLHLGTEPSCWCFTHHPPEPASEWHNSELLPPAMLPQGRICQQPCPSPGERDESPTRKRSSREKGTPGEIPLCSPRDGHRSGGLTGSFPSLYLTISGCCQVVLSFGMAAFHAGPAQKRRGASVQNSWQQSTPRGR